MIVNPCPCWSGIEYTHCCEPYHLGEPPFTALLLMRARYSAYALGLFDFIISTTHPSHPNSKKQYNALKEEILAFSKNTVFSTLTIHLFEESGSHAIVIFTAGLSSLDHKDLSFTEKSFFEKVENKWLYLKGIIT